jgi:hypothetical protein
MKNFGIVAATVLALSLAGPSFAEDLDSAHDCVEKGGHMDGGKCVGVAAAVAAPAAAGAAAGGTLSTGAALGIGAVVVTAIAVGVSGGSKTTQHGTGGTTH